MVVFEKILTDSYEDARKADDLLAAEVLTAEEFAAANPAPRVIGSRACADSYTRFQRHCPLS